MAGDREERSNQAELYAMPSTRQLRFVFVRPSADLQDHVDCQDREARMGLLGRTRHPPKKHICKESF